MKLVCSWFSSLVIESAEPLSAVRTQAVEWESFLQVFTIITAEDETNQRIDEETNVGKNSGTIFQDLIEGRDCSWNSSFPHKISQKGEDMTWKPAGKKARRNCKQHLSDCDVLFSSSFFNVRRLLPFLSSFEATSNG